MGLAKSAIASVTFIWSDCGHQPEHLPCCRANLTSEKLASLLERAASQVGRVSSALQLTHVLVTLLNHHRRRHLLLLTHAQRYFRASYEPPDSATCSYCLIASLTQQSTSRLLHRH